ncbi:leucine-rich repeat domain-containing protein [Aquimarina sp. MMG016]|uniref:leucine-rich repeat domain-containing protein n=1 Tax=Aquimarina sp. MMG016 TaxID=2822690 RepID=UPI001B3A66D1|nr:leucine-rich repeat domain-containing protein [Aquimarina sp. MMG016]MBQ4820918.1 leucine-rich repeat domain-containing protein [Aquimarina sp. MMG016]
MKNKYFLRILFFISITTSYAQYTSIPDANFEAALDALGYDDISGDGQVPTNNINTIITLDISSQNISDLTGIEGFVALEELIAYENMFTTIDLSNNSALEILDLSNTPLTELDLSALTNLKELTLVNTDLNALDVTTNIGLTSFIATSNNVEYYDLRNNTLLEVVVISSSATKFINIKNGNNENITNHAIYGDPDLCVAVDNLTYSQTNWVNAQSTDIYTDGFCRYTAIPDANFEAALSAYDDIANDGQVPTENIATVTTLNIANNSINSLDGIEDFTALGTLRCTNNSITTLDLSALTNLTFLWCNQNQLTALDISNNTALTFVNASQNTINSFNGTGLNLLEVLYLWSNQLSSIDVSDMTALTELDMFGNLLTSLDVSNTTGLQEINLRGNSLTTLDLSNNTALIEVDVRNNDVMSLNIKNGNNTNITSFTATSNPNLTCILVDDAAYSTANWTSIDAQTSFSDTYCRYTAIPDANFEAALETLGYDDISGDGQVPTVLIENVTILTIQFANISDLTGIEDFIAIEDLIISYNGFTSLDVSNNLNLTYLECGYSSLSSLDVSNNTLLETLWVNTTPITSLDLSQNVNLVDLVASSNNALTSLNIQNGNNTNMTRFDTDGSNNLTCVLVDDASYSTTNWTDIGDNTSFSETSCTTDYALAIKAFVQGAALNPNEGEESLLRDDLRVAGLIPTTSPYTDGLTCDASVFTATGADAIVDWVWVELRDQNDATIVIAGQSALLQRDGDIVAADGVSEVAFSIEADDYYVLITHRNHLGIRSANTVSLSATTAILDLTTDTSLILGGTNAVTEIRNGTYAMLAGDGDANGQIQNTDINTVITLLGGSGYSDADMDMNGQVQNTDINNLMNPNVGKGEQF